MLRSRIASTIAAVACLALVDVAFGQRSGGMFNAQRPAPDPAQQPFRPALFQRPAYPQSGFGRFEPPLLDRFAPWDDCITGLF